MDRILGYDAREVAAAVVVAVEEEEEEAEEEEEEDTTDELDEENEELLYKMETGLKVQGNFDGETDIDCERNIELGDVEVEVDMLLLRLMRLL